MTNAKVLGQALTDFDTMEDYQQELVADYIGCPSAPDCAWDGKTEHLHICTECKVRWLNQEWEG